MSEDSLTKRSLEFTSLTSAGIMSPADTSIISPGTSSCMLTSFFLPSLMTVIFTLTISINLSMSLFDRYSCENSIPMLMSIIAKMNIALNISAYNNVNIPMNKRTIIKGLVNFRSSWTIGGLLSRFIGSLYPCSLALASASASLNPSSELFNSLRMLPMSVFAYSKYRKFRPAVTCSPNHPPLMEKCRDEYI